MIEVSKLTKVYGTRKALDGVSFSIQSGEIVGFLGPNGAGKSTTMKIITGYLSPTEGQATVGGYNVEDEPMKIRSMIGYLPELNPIYEDMKVAEYLKFIAEIRGIPRRSYEKSIEKVVKSCGLAAVFYKLISELSKGFCQRVGLASA